MVHRAIQQHQGATASAERSLALAENCLDMGVTTLEEVARQGEGLDKADRGLDMLQEEVAEADSLIKFMSRCCLFQVMCCCCAESKEEIRRDRTRRQRLKQRREDDEVVRRAMNGDTNGDTNGGPKGGPKDGPNGRPNGRPHGNGARGHDDEEL